MNWKTNIQLTDLDDTQRLEVTCKVCGHSRYESPHMLVAKYGLEFAYVDEVERLLICHARDCNGSVRVALSHQGETEGFVGGLA